MGSISEFIRIYVFFFIGVISVFFLIKPNKGRLQVSDDKKMIAKEQEIIKYNKRLGVITAVSSFMISISAYCNFSSIEIIGFIGISIGYALSFKRKNQ